jgi:hypothetical protein
LLKGKTGHMLSTYPGQILSRIWSDQTERVGELRTDWFRKVDVRKLRERWLEHSTVEWQKRAAIGVAAAGCKQDLAH